MKLKTPEMYQVRSRAHFADGKLSLRTYVLKEYEAETGDEELGETACGDGPYELSFYFNGSDKAGPTISFYQRRKSTDPDLPLWAVQIERANDEHYIFTADEFNDCFLLLKLVAPAYLISTPWAV